MLKFLATLLFFSTSPMCLAMDVTPKIIAEQQSTFENPFIAHTIYGDFEVTEPVLIDLFNSPTMERIKHVLQYGVADYVIKQNKEYTRYEHCVGVWALLRMHGATLEEQIAGLLHDASHTVFSHVGDVLFKHTSSHSSYQDDIHEWYLQKQNIDLLLAQHAISLYAVLHKSGAHTMLEQDLPDICADRLEYNLQAGILTDMLTFDDIMTLLHDIRYTNSCWYFINKESAKKLALVSLFNTEHVWGGPADYFIQKWTADALQRALSIELLTNDDIHFSTDSTVWDTLWSSDDDIIIECLNKIIHYKDLIITTSPKEGQFLITGKFRGLDPLVKENDTFKRLTDLDDEYKKEYNRVKMQVTQGWGVQLHDLQPVKSNNFCYN